jgi:integrase
MRDLSVRYENEHCAHHIKPSTRENYKLLLRKYILPAIGHMKVTAVTRADIASLHHSMSGRPTNANRMLEVVSKMFNLSELWGWRADGTNPRRHIKKYKENKRDRYLSVDEIKRLGEALHMAEEANLASIYAVAAFRLLVLTGARLNEIQTCKWEYVSLDQGLIRLPDSKTGPRFIHLGRTAVFVLRNIPRKEGNPYVICSDHFSGEHINDLQKTWQMLRDWAGLKDVRIHDLRHTFASSAVGMGMSLPIIGKMLGHTQTQTTARYAHLAVSPVLDAATEVTGMLGELLALPAPAATDDGHAGHESGGDHQAITIILPLKQKMGDASQFLTSDEAARYLGVQQRLMENWRWRRTGPKFIKIGNRIRYTMEDLKGYVELGAKSKIGQQV